MLACEFVGGLKFVWIIPFCPGGLYGIDSTNKARNMDIMGNSKPF